MDPAVTCTVVLVILVLFVTDRIDPDIVAVMDVIVLRFKPDNIAVKYQRFTASQMKIVQLAAFDQEIAETDLIGGKYLLVQRGKKNYFLIIAK